MRNENWVGMIARISVSNRARPHLFSSERALAVGAVGTPRRHVHQFRRGGAAGPRRGVRLFELGTYARERRDDS